MRAGGVGAGCLPVMVSKVFVKNAYMLTRIGHMYFHESILTSRQDRYGLSNRIIRCFISKNSDSIDQELYVKDHQRF